MQGDTLKSKGRKSVPYATLGVLLARGLNVFSVLYIVRELSTDDWAVYSLFLGMMTYFCFFSNLGVSGMLQRFLPVFISEGHMGAARRAAVIAMGLKAVLILLLLGGFFLLFKPMSEFLNMPESAVGLFAIFSIAILCFSLTEALTVAMNASFGHKWVTLSQAVLFVSKVPGLIWVFSADHGLMGVLVVEAVSNALSIAVLLAAFAVHMPGRGEESKDEIRKRLPRMARFTGFNLLYGTGNLFLEPATALIIISHYLNRDDLAFYAFAVRMNLMAFNLIPAMVLQSVIRPMFYTRFSQENDHAVLQRMFRILVQMNILILAPLVAMVLLFGEQLVNLLKPEMLPAVNLLMVIAFVNMLRFTELPVDLTLQALERVDIHCYSRIFSVASVIGCVLAIDTWGTMGVAVLFGCGMLARNLFMYIFAKAYAGISIGWVPLVRALGNTGFASACVYFLCGEGTHVLVGLAVFCATYAAISLAHRTFNHEQKGTLESILPRFAFML